MEPRGALPALCLHPTCLESCLEEPDVPAPMRLPAVRATVLFAMGDKRREGSEKGKENRLARSPESQLNAVGELGVTLKPQQQEPQHPVAPHCLQCAPAWNHLPPHSLCQTAQSYGAPHAPSPFLSDPGQIHSSGLYSSSRHPSDTFTPNREQRVQGLKEETFPVMGSGY